MQKRGNSLQHSRISGALVGTRNQKQNPSIGGHFSGESAPKRPYLLEFMPKRYICLNRCVKLRLTVKVSGLPLSLKSAWSRCPRTTAAIALVLTIVAR
jgi:hypothetical protein